MESGRLNQHYDAVRFCISTHGTAAVQMLCVQVRSRFASNFLRIGASCRTNAVMQRATNGASERDAQAPAGPQAQAGAILARNADDMLTNAKRRVPQNSLTY
jgi:hypothetical protein